ncbi:MAG: HAD family hydrolase [Alphaproteobacteria bacterium]|nr:HAD family hydrolase [Alphaproteobacteria bacterium]
MTETKTTTKATTKAATGKRKALFLDRDGVINVDRGYVGSRKDFFFVPGVFQALRAVQDKGYLLVVVTNQSGIGRGLFSEADYQALTKWMRARLRQEGIEIAAVYHDPTHPTEAKGNYLTVSENRKPAPGMILQAAQDLDLDLDASAMIGDKASDVEAGKAAGVGQIFQIESGDALSGVLEKI